MYRPRIIPCLLLKDLGLVKTIKFKHPSYIGDPMNAINIFNKKKADELIFLDIMATSENRSINSELVSRMGEECMMPFAVGGGIRSMKDIETLFKAGAEKVVINSEALLNPSLIETASKHYGSQSIVISIDVKKKIFGGYLIYGKRGKKATNYDLIDYLKIIENYGAGEVFINAIDKDGTYSGYDINLIKIVSNQVKIPVIACGGAGSIHDFKPAINEGRASAVAAGSIFVYHGAKRAVLINYPTSEEKIELFKI
ncbi:MAG: imidazole glycerol phosphate synthase subunit HisF [Candidatus Marinimicrobia bacterium]|nr:imidazole glycerol phosphate synthase subunit HisF [Candidatus Neomarinimicrobiota bacterium]